VLLGDMVRTSSSGEWRVFSRRMSDYLAGDRTQETGVTRMPVVPVAGDHDAMGDEFLKGWGATFPGAGRDIGFNRVGSWYVFDLDTAGHNWRVVILDPGKERLGSRWKEQVNWLEQAVGGRHEGLLVFMHEPLFDLGGPEVNMNPGGGAEELLTAIDEITGMSALRAVFTAGSHTSHVMLPDGPFGTLHVNAGGGGAPAHPLLRWGPADQTGRPADVHLETQFDLALLDRLRRWDEVNPVGDGVLDKARAKGSHEGFTGIIDGDALPTHGWWDVTLMGEALHVAFRHRLPNGQVDEIYRIVWADGEGWKPMRG